MTKKYSWFLVALFAVMIAAPNGTIIRASVLEADVYYFTLCRFSLIGIICLPFILISWKKLITKAVRRDVIISSIALSIALISYGFALKYSQASYVSIITLLMPIVFIVVSARMFNEKVSKRIITGVTLAMIGAMTLVILPLALSQNGTAFYPVATILALIVCVAHTFAIVYMRRANEQGVSMPSIIGVSAWVAVGVCAMLFLLFGDKQATPTDSSYWIAVVYSGVVVALIGRAMNVLSYERVGAATMSALAYLETFIAILIPVFVLNEKLSPAMVVGGIFILLGIYVIEHHRHPHAKHHITMRHH